MYRKRVALLLAAVGIAAGLVIAWTNRTPASLLELSPSNPAPITLRDCIGRLIPNSPRLAWAWQAEEAVFGKRKPVNLDMDVVRLTGEEPALRQTCENGTLLGETHALRAWIVEAERLNKLRSHLKQSGKESLIHPRISTTDGVEAVMFVGSTIQLGGRQNEIGSTVRCYARAGTSSTDLRLFLLSVGLRTNELSAVESVAKEQITVVTNFQTAFRIQIPKGKGAVLLAGAGSQHGVASFGILISPPR